MKYLAYVFLTICLLNSGCKKPPPSANVPAKPVGPKMVRFDPKALERLGIKIQAVGGAENTATVTVPGTLEYNLEHYAEVGTIVEGRITNINAHVGKPVKRGQRLATMLVPSIAAAQAEYQAAKASFSATKEHAARESQLLSKELTTAREEEIAQSESVKAESQLKAAEARLKVIGAELPGDVHSAIQSAGTLALTSPIDGVVVRQDAVLGAFLTPNEKAFVVADPHELWATIDVYESDIENFRKDAEVDVQVEAIPGRTFHGKIALVEPQLGQSSRALRARISVPNQDGVLQPGMFVRASVKVANRPGDGRLRVPVGAVQPIGSEDVVFVEREPGQFEVREVRVGRRTAQIAEIIEGLSLGDRLVIDGAFLLRGEVTKQ